MITFALASILFTAAQPIRLTTGLVIRHSTKVMGTWFNLPNSDDSGKTSVITIKGDNITVDFNGATMIGTPETTEPDKRKGTAVIIEGKNVVVKNLKAKGYKIALIARNSPGVRILNCDFSYNWKQKLLSTLDREDGADWMSFHHNENDEWLRYGCGIYLRKCDGFEVTGTKIVGGQSGLYLMECNKGLVANNNFSFLSAVGIAMYLSSENRIMHNNIDWCVRGYSHGKWNRGQDSAGIIIYEQSNQNVFAYNSVTHGGDGFFLWAGQTSMDTGKGGCNDNLLYGNDWSHAPTNGIEATFSRNKFVNNLVMECWHGIWGGFSWESLVLGNVFAYNAEGIALEHGQDNKFSGNIFYRDNTALNIWQNASIDPNWGYGKAKDCRSRDYQVTGNTFSQITNRVMSLRDTINFQFVNNRFGPVKAYVDLKGNTSGYQAKPAEVAPSATMPQVMMPSGNLILPYPEGDAGYFKRFETNWNPLSKTPVTKISVGGEPDIASLPADAFKYAPKPLVGGKNPFLKPGALRGRKYILVDEWGPYDFQRPLIWPRGDSVDNMQHFEVLGPKGTATLKEIRGARIVEVDGKSWAGDWPLKVPCMVKVRYETGKGNDFLLDLVYTGGQTTDYRGIVTPKGKPVRFSFSKFVLPIDWTVKFFQWDKDKSDPRTQPDAFAAILAGKPVKEVKVSELDFPGDIPGVPSDYFATVGEGTFEVPAGTYSVDVTTDDGCKVWVDGELVIKDAWHYQGPTPYSAELKLAAGRHTIKLWHFEINGYSAIKVGIKPKR